MQQDASSERKVNENSVTSDAGAGKTTLTGNQMRSLQAYGYLLLRMGLFERAQRLFRALGALDPDDRWVLRNLAYTSLLTGNPQAALDYLRRAIGQAPLPSDDAVLHLLKAQALWRLERKDEAQNSVNTYLAMTSTQTLAQD